MMLPIDRDDWDEHGTTEVKAMEPCKAGCAGLTRWFLCHCGARVLGVYTIATYDTIPNDAHLDAIAKAHPGAKLIYFDPRDYDRER